MSGFSGNPAVDAYLEAAVPPRCLAEAKPMLQHLRGLVHEAVPDVAEAMKWRMPFFVYRGVILGNMAAFKSHCSFGLWDGTLKQAEEGMGSFGKLRSPADLPPDAELRTLLTQAARRIDSGERKTSWEGRQRKATDKVAVPEELVIALCANPLLQAAWVKLTPSCQREYNEWIGGAKQEATRVRRLEKAIPRIVDGKRMN